MAPAKTRKRKSDQGISNDPTVESSASDDTKRQRKLPVRAKGGESAEGSKPISAPAKGTMMVFGDDDDKPAAAVSAAPLKPAASAPEQEEEEEEDSDDEAPEAVSTTKLASDIKKSSQVAQKAAQEQAAAQKRKRREKDAFFKQRAEERKRAEEEQSKAAEGASDGDAEPLVPRPRVGRAPNLLPAEFLADSSSEDEAAGEGDDGAAAARPRKRRVAAVERSLTRLDRGPRDQTVGSTVYRVAKKVDDRMVPKMRKHAKSSKDLLLRRHRSAAKPRSGFFVK
ncbi:hypothetical protein ACJ41O_004194 [Fusarium nematophilum]